MMVIQLRQRQYTKLNIIRSLAIWSVMLSIRESIKPPDDKGLFPKDKRGI
jgi:hypothetical protein